jgi:uncharacterized protein (TIGR02145 family)
MKRLIMLAAIAIGMMACCKEPIPVQLPVVAVKPAINVTITSATLVAQVVPNDESVSITFEYKTQNGTNWSSVPVSGSFSGKTAVEVNAGLSALASNTAYVYRIKATNSAGAVTSSEGQFQTGAIAPGIAIKAVSNLNLTSVTLNAKVVGKDGPTSVTFETKLKGATTWTSNPATGVFSGQDSVLVSLNLSSLAKNTEYVVRAKATNAGGQTISAEADFWTYEVADIDGNFYHTVDIGNQTWMVENLKTTKFRDGTPIPNKTENRDWSRATAVAEPAYCWYNNDPSFKVPYGALYNWHVASDPKIAPTGYHVPTYEEFAELISFLGGASIAGVKLKAAGPAAGWQAPSQADNSSRFSALPAGFRGDSPNGDGISEDFRNYTYFWSSSQFGSGGDAMFLKYSSSLAENDGIFNRSYGFSIRCLKDK